MGEDGVGEGGGGGGMTEVVIFREVWKVQMESLTERFAVTIKVKKVEKRTRSLA